VGGIIMWWGNIGSIPENFELCDGQGPSTSGATLVGLKPDLRDRFPKGATTGVTNDAASAVSGGANTIGQRITGGTTLTTAQMPAHSHGVSDPGHSHSIGVNNGGGNPPTFIGVGGPANNAPKSTAV